MLQYLKRKLGGLELKNASEIFSQFNLIYFFLNIPLFKTLQQKNSNQFFNAIN